MEGEGGLRQMFQNRSYAWEQWHWVENSAPEELKSQISAAKKQVVWDNFYLEFILEFILISTSPIVIANIMCQFGQG